MGIWVLEEVLELVRDRIGDLLQLGKRQQTLETDLARRPPYCALLCHAKVSYSPHILPLKPRGRTELQCAATPKLPFASALARSIMRHHAEVTLQPAHRYPSKKKGER